MAIGNFNVNVECEGGKLFEARVIGYDEEKMTIKVQFISDNLTIKKYVEEPITQGWGGMGPGDDGERYNLVEKDVPVKEFTTLFTNIKFMGIKCDSCNDTR